jgi:hypothetical protein
MRRFGFGMDPRIRLPYCRLSTSEPTSSVSWEFAGESVGRSHYRTKECAKSSVETVGVKTRQELFDEGLLPAK